jgi:hypothetical protein
MLAVKGKRTTSLRPRTILQMFVTVASEFIFGDGLHRAAELIVVLHNNGHSQ